VRKVDQLDHAVDHRVAEGNQSIEEPLLQSTDYNLDKQARVQEQFSDKPGGYPDCQNPDPALGHRLTRSTPAEQSQQHDAQPSQGYIDDHGAKALYNAEGSAAEDRPETPFIDLS
jgi:hypothetical protein